MHSNAVTYRRDIDGLRAVAVLSVLVNHVSPRLLPPGFIGVDIFFVISGFLITRIVFDAAASGQFSYLDFYWRRCRRIIPALAVVLTATWLLGLALLTGPELTSLGRHLVAAGTFSSNVLLWREVGYFDTDAGAKPLLHLWSLGVEEQFYLVWPTLLVTLVGLKMRVRVATLALLGTASLILSFTLSSSSPGAAFYLLHTRFWELLAGGLLAIVTSPYAGSSAAKFAARVSNPRSANVLSIVGSVVLGIAFLTINSTRPYPGLWALLPVLGTVALIAAGPNAHVNRTILGHPVAVWFGLISYPLYLWHWPLLSYAQIVGPDLGVSDGQVRVVRVLLAVLSVLLAYLTFRFVEKPAQAFGNSLSLRGVRRGGAIGLFLLPLVLAGVIGIASFSSGGWPSRYEGFPGERAILEAATRQSGLRYGSSPTACSLHSGQFRPTWCFQSASQSPDVALLGDSHADALYPGIVDAMPKQSVLLVAHNGCAPLLGIAVADGIQTARCVSAMQSALELIRTTNSIKTVVIVSRGPMYLSGHGYGQADEAQTAYVNISLDERTQASRSAAFEDGLTKMIQALQGSGKTVVLMQDVPELGFDAKDCVVGRPLHIRRPHSPCAISEHDVLVRNSTYVSVLHHVAAKTSARIFDPSEVVCSATECTALDGNQLLYRDDDHLSVEGSKRVGKKLVRYLSAPTQ